jgi:soluble lytic murein transglycosylase
MQIKPIVGNEWAQDEREKFADNDLFDAGANTRIGAWYLQKLLKRYRNTDNPLPYALADYNAGRKNLLKWNKGIASTNSAAFIEAIGYPSTKHYVRTVMERCADYEPVFPGKME